MRKNTHLKISAFEEEYFAHQISEERAAIFLQVPLLHLQTIRQNNKGPRWNYNDDLKPVYRRGDLVSWLELQKRKRKRR